MFATIKTMVRNLRVFATYAITGQTETAASTTNPGIIKPRANMDVIPGSWPWESDWNDDIAPAHIPTEAQKLCWKIQNEMRHQMKWRPRTCRTGTSRWSVKLSVADPHVFYEALRLSPTNRRGKKWKQQKMDMARFHQRVAPFLKNDRHGHLIVTGQHVNIKWNEEQATFNITGTYGLMKRRRGWAGLSVAELQNYGR